jgi:hypothetical protein
MLQGKLIFKPLEKSPEPEPETHKEKRKRWNANNYLWNRDSILAKKKEQREAKRKLSGKTN